MDSQFLVYFIYCMACKTGETRNATAPCRVINLTTYKKQNVAEFSCVQQDISSRCTHSNRYASNQHLPCASVPHPEMQFYAFLFQYSSSEKEAEVTHCSLVSLQGPRASQSGQKPCNIFSSYVHLEKLFLRKQNHLHRLQATAVQHLVLRVVGSYIPFLFPPLLLKHLFTSSK